MQKTTKHNKTNPPVKVRDLKPKKEAKGGSNVGTYSYSVGPNVRDRK